MLILNCLCTYPSDIHADQNWLNICNVSACVNLCGNFSHHYRTASWNKMNWCNVWENSFGGHVIILGIFQHTYNIWMSLTLQFLSDWLGNSSLVQFMFITQILPYGKNQITSTEKESTIVIMLYIGVIFSLLQNGLETIQCYWKIPFCQWSISHISLISLKCCITPLWWRNPTE